MVVEDTAMGLHCIGSECIQSKQFSWVSKYHHHIEMHCCHPRKKKKKKKMKEKKIHVITWKLSCYFIINVIVWYWACFFLLGLQQCVSVPQHLEEKDKMSKLSLFKKKKKKLFLLRRRLRQNRTVKRTAAASSAGWQGLKCAAPESVSD